MSPRIVRRETARVNSDFACFEQKRCAKRVFADDVMDTSSLDYPQEKAAHNRIFSAKRPKFALEPMMDMRVSVNGQCDFFDSDLFRRVE